MYAPSSLAPRRRSDGSNSANQRGGILQVAVIICETLSSTTSELILIASSIFWGRKNLINVVGKVDLKSSRAAQHLVAVYLGAIYLFPSSSNT